MRHATPETMNVDRYTYEAFHELMAHAWGDFVPEHTLAYGRYEFAMNYTRGWHQRATGVI